MHPRLPLQLVARYAPILYLHPDESYFPCTPQWYLERSELLWCPQGVDAAYAAVPALRGAQVLLPEDRVTEATLEEAMREYGPEGGRNLLLHLESEEHAKGQGMEGLSEIPLYAHIKLAVDDDGQPEAWEINYMTFYAYNGAHSLFGMPCLQVGAHVGDWEHLTVRLDAASLALQGVWYNSHRNIEGEWRPAAKVPRDPLTGRLVAFVAKDGHGLYPKAGLIPRIFCAANDVTSAQGPVWRPKQVVVLCHGHDGYGWRQHRSRGCTLPAVLPGEQDRKHLQGEGHGLDDRGHIPGAGGECRGVAVVGRDLTAGIGVVEEGGPEASAAAGAAAARATAVQTAASPPAAAVSRLLPQPPLLQSSAPCSTGGGSSGDGLPELLLDSTSVWQRFTGYWGTAEAPCMQGWFHNVEPPLSRGAFTRLCLPLARGIDRLPAKLRGKLPP